MHHVMIKTLRGIVKESGVPKVSIVEEARGMRPDGRSHPVYLVVLYFAEGGQHLVIDGVVTNFYRNSVLSKVGVNAGFAAKQVKDKKFKADKDSLHPVSVVHGGRTSQANSLCHGGRRPHWSPRTGGPP